MPGFMGKICCALSHKGKSWGKKGCLTMPIQQVWNTSQLSVESTVQYSATSHFWRSKASMHRVSSHSAPPLRPELTTPCPSTILSSQSHVLHAPAHLTAALHPLTPHPLHCSSGRTHHPGCRKGGQPLLQAAPTSPCPGSSCPRLQMSASQGVPVLSPTYPAR